MKYQMKYDKQSRWITSIFGVLLLLCLAFIYYTSGGSYFPAWLTTLVVSIALLGVLSIPRHVDITSISVEIHCILELTRIPLYQIDRVKILDKSDMKWCFPFFGVFGIFGYYGYFFDLKRFRTFKMYSRRWSNFVLIEDIYENRVIVGVDDPLDFIAHIDSLK